MEKHTHIFLVDKPSIQTILNPRTQEEFEMAFMADAYIAALKIQHRDLVFDSPVFGKIYRKTIEQ